MRKFIGLITQTGRSNSTSMSKVSPLSSNILLGSTTRMVEDLKLGKLRSAIVNDFLDSDRTQFLFPKANRGTTNIHCEL